MTYTPDDRNLASIAKMLPGDAMQVWCDAANQAEEMGLDRNECIKSAWTEVGKSWHRPAVGKKWIAKDSPAAGDVHVDAPLGSDGKRKKKPLAEPPESTVKFQTTAQVCKVSDELGIVFGYAIVCKRDGQDYFDLQNDHIPEDAMVRAAADFMLNSRVGGDMHEQNGDGGAVQAGDIVFAFPMTGDIAKALDIQTNTTGLLIGYKPNDTEVLNKYRSGEYTGFSIGGSRVRDEVVA